MRRMHQRTGRLQHVQAASARFVDCVFRSAVGRDHDCSRAHVGGLLRQADAPRAQFRQHGFVMDEVAQYGERLLFRGFQRQCDGVFTPKHMPRCSARMIFILTLCHKVKDHDDSNVFKIILFGLVLPDDLFQQIDVISEGFAARRR